MHLNYTAKVVRFSDETHITRPACVHVRSPPEVEHRRGRKVSPT